MRAKLDENLPVEAADLLRKAGWECDTVYDEGLAGADDPELAAACQAGARVLMDNPWTIGSGSCSLTGPPLARRSLDEGGYWLTARS
jgi:predicted nuclease of predicted toxin-antitoxin system